MVSRTSVAAVVGKSLEVYMAASECIYSNERKLATAVENRFVHSGRLARPSTLLFDAIFGQHLTFRQPRK